MLKKPAIRSRECHVRGRLQRKPIAVAESRLRERRRGDAKTCSPQSNYNGSAARAEENWPSAALPRQAQEASCYGALPYLYPAGFPGRPIADTSLLCCILFESLVVVFICFLAIFIGGCVICCICWPLSCFLGAVLKIKTSGTSLTQYIYRRIPFVCLFVCPWRRLTPTNPRHRLGYLSIWSY